MHKISVRVPDEIVSALDRAEGNRSKLVRTAVQDAITEGEIEVPEEIKTLAAREKIVDKGALTRKRGTFRERCHEYFGERWEKGATTPKDADDLAESWRSEAVLYGEEYLRFVNAVVNWFAENYEPGDPRPWPDPGTFMVRTGEVEVDVTDRLAQTMKDAKSDGLDRRTAVERVSKYHPEERVEAAAAEVWK